MTWGFLARNDDGTVVIDATMPVMCEAGRVTLTADGSSGGYYRFQDYPLAPGAGPRFARLRADQWVSFMPVGLMVYPVLGFASSNQDEIELVEMNVPANLPAPSGYGRVLFNGGVRVWDASRATASIADGLLLKFADLAPASTWNATLAGDAVYAFGGYTEVSFSTRRTDGLAARRLSPGVIQLEHRTIWPGAMSSPTAVSEAGVSAMTAWVS